MRRVSFRVETFLDTNLGGADFRLLLVDASIVLLHGPDFDHCVECIGMRGKG